MAHGEGLDPRGGEVWPEVLGCVARFISYGDWYLAHQLGLVDRYSETPLALMGADLDETYLEHAPLVAQGVRRTLIRADRAAAAPVSRASGARRRR